MIKSLSLCLVTDHRRYSLASYLHFLSEAIRGGVTSIQFRDKENPLPVVRETAKIIKQFLQPYHIPLIINDYVELAAEIDADGIHVGQSDLAPIRARELLGPDKLIGYSVESLPQLERANQLDCIDYIAASAVFPSKTKTDCKTIWGLQGLREIAKLSKHPIVAIGGITPENAADVITHGACGIAVVSNIHDNVDPAMAASQLIQQIQKGKSYV